MSKFVWFGGPAAKSAGKERAGLIAQEFNATVKQKYYPGHGRDLGTLAESINPQEQSNHWIVTTDIVYAPFIEFGTSRGIAPQKQFRETAQELAAKYREVSY